MKPKTVQFIGKKYVKNTCIIKNQHKNTSTPQPDT